EELISKMRRSLEVEPAKEGLPEASTSKCCTNSVWSVLSVIANTAPESSAIQRTCDSEEEGYTGTDAAPAAHTAKSNSDHSYRVSEIIMTRSPCSTPAAIMPLATSYTSRINSFAVTLTHSLVAGRVNITP